MRSTHVYTQRVASHIRTMHYYKPIRRSALTGAIVTFISCQLNFICSKNIHLQLEKWKKLIMDSDPDPNQSQNAVDSSLSLS